MFVIVICVPKTNKWLNGTVILLKSHKKLLYFAVIDIKIHACIVGVSEGDLRIGEKKNTGVTNLQKHLPIYEITWMTLQVVLIMSPVHSRVCDVYLHKKAIVEGKQYL